MEILNKYAKLLTKYCLDLKKGDKLFVKTTTLAEPLVREVYREALKLGANPEVELDFRGKNRILLEEGTETQLQYTPSLYSKAMNEFDAFLYIRAPFNLREEQDVSPEKRSLRSKALNPIMQTYFERTADRSLKRSLCQFPTLASAQEAGMSLEAYEKFVYNACKLYDEDPEASWLEVRKEQQKIVDLLNSKDRIRYKNKNFDINFSVKDRIWINSDGQTNMPSGEVFSAPIEDSVQGEVYFSFPSIYMGKEVKGIRLTVENGEVIKWDAEQGNDLLDEVFKIPGARRFGEVAIGTNYNIQRSTKNILFDEKIGGTIHMAVGQSYKQNGGKNQSAIHWDMITDMQDGGEIYADGELIYKNGKFIVF